MTDRVPDKEKNRFTARAMRYASVGANVGGVAARIASRRLFGLDPERDKDAASLAAALGGLKGPIMKVAQLLATIPEALPAEYAAELDRKSTRLNSSHMSISYAVFCLKKKKQKSKI